MSHFTTLVIGPDINKQLEPFSENLEVPEYDRGPVDQKELDHFVEYYIKDSIEKDLSVEKLYELHGEDWNGNSWRKAEDGKFHEYSTYNPDSKWDWYQLGGRWTGFFKLKDNADGVAGSPGLMTNPARSGWVDQAIKKDIDFESMRVDEEQKYREHYRGVAALFGGKIPRIESWKSVRERISDIDEARAIYNGQAEVLAFRKSDLSGIFGSLEDYPETEEEYALQGRRSAITTFAIVKDGEWYERGKMGWWGMVSDEKEDEAWDKEFSDLLDSLPDDTLLSVVDCHI